MSKIKFIASGADPGFSKTLKGDGGWEGWGGVGIGYPGEIYFHRTCNFRHDANLRFWCLAFKCRNVTLLYQNIVVIRQSDRRSWILAMLKVANFIYKKNLSNRSATGDKQDCNEQAFFRMQEFLTVSLKRFMLDTFPVAFFSSSQTKSCGKTFWCQSRGIRKLLEHLFPEIAHSFHRDSLWNVQNEIVKQKLVTSVP